LAPKYDSATLYNLCTSKEPSQREEGFQVLGEILFGPARNQLNTNQFDDASVQDLVQDALEIIWAKISTEEGPNSARSFIAWSCRIVKNKCIDKVRQKKRRKTDSLEAVGYDEKNGADRIMDQDSPNPADEALKKDTIEHIVAAIENASLSDNEKIVLIEGYLDDKTDKELSKMLDTTDANIKVIRHRALKKLRVVVIKNSSLSDNEKTVLIEGHFGDKTDKELSKMLDTTDANIKVIRHRALRKLRDDDDLLTSLSRLL